MQWGSGKMGQELMKGRNTEETGAQRLGGSCVQDLEVWSRVSDW